MGFNGYQREGQHQDYQPVLHTKKEGFEVKKGDIRIRGGRHATKIDICFDKKEGHILKFDINRETTH